MLSLTLSYAGREREVIGLVDSGAMLNVLPYHIGLELGAVWDSEAAILSLGGSFRGVPAMGLAVVGKIGTFPPFNLFFAWAGSDDVRVILGQYNFFQEFDVHFYRSQFVFEIHPKGQRLSSATG
ncbi:MAG: hypothetical protein RMJ60_04340 [Anaerolineales bacterium]|nr:hypothetical protein [Anaerolineales bacterium]